MPSVKTDWHTKITAVLEHLICHVLNDSRVLILAYKKLSIERLVARVTHCQSHVLAVGQRYSWLINAKTCHK